MAGPAAWCRARYRDFSREKPHPLTGDMLRPGERVTWQVMGVYRRWSVFIGLQLLTFAWWLWPGLFPGGLFGWNLLWSDLAVAVEMLVGIAFLNQAMRDARVIRQALRDIGADGDLLREQLAELKADTVLIREIHAALRPGGAGQVTLVPRPYGGSALEMRRTGGR